MVDTIDRESQEQNNTASYGLNKSEEEKCDRAFQLFDKYNTGQIDAAALKRVLARMGQTTSDQEIDKMIKEASPDNSGQISKD